jgi:hypothetical protein
MMTFRTFVWAAVGVISGLIFALAQLSNTFSVRLPREGL